VRDHLAGVTDHHRQQLVLDRRQVDLLIARKTCRCARSTRRFRTANTGSLFPVRCLTRGARPRGSFHQFAGAEGLVKYLSSGVEAFTLSCSCSSRR